MDWGDLGKNVFGGVHFAGKALATAFGFGKPAAALEQAEAGAGILPDWARTDSAPPSTPTAQAPMSSASAPISAVELAQLTALQRRLAAAQAHIRATGNEGGTVPHSDHLTGITILGAMPKPAKKPPKFVGGLRRGKSPHKAALAASQNASKHAENAAQAASQAVKKYNAKEHKALSPVAATAVRGLVMLVAVSKALTATQKQKVAKHANAILANRVAIERVKRTGAAALRAAAEAKAVAAKAKPVIDKMTKAKSPPMPTHVRGQDVLGEAAYYDQFVPSVPLIMVGVDPIPDPTNPGFMTDGSPDPNYTGGGTSDPGSTGDPYGGVAVPDASNPGYLTDGSTDPNWIPLPVRDQPMSQAEAQQVWDDVPDDGVVYGGERGLPGATFYSYNLVYGAGDGFFWNGDHWVARRGGSDRDVDQDDERDAYAASLRYNWGPIFGQPSGQLPGIQWARKKRVWFFQSPHAPAWLTAGPDAALLLLNQKTADATRQAAAADAARVAQEQRAAEEARAKQEAADALAQEHADAQAKVADTTAQQQQAAQQAQLDLDQQRIDMQQQAAQADFERQMALAQAQNGGDGGGFDDSDAGDFGDGTFPAPSGGATGDVDPYKAMFDAADTSPDEMMGYGSDFAEIAGLAR